MFSSNPYTEFHFDEWFHTLNPSFLSFYFIVFVLLLLFVYYLVPGRVQWVVLLAGSIAFYSTAGVNTLVFVLMMSFIVYCAGVCTGCMDQEGDCNKQKKKSRFYLMAGSIVLLVILLFCKLHSFLEWKSGFVVPLGISYYTFSSIGYLADVYWKKDQPEGNYFKLLLFILFFPKILQGPVAKHRILAGYLYQGHRFDYRSFCFGAQLVIWGYFKKMVIADRIALFTATVFSDEGAPGGAVLCIAVILSAVQIYSDFSGCMDIAAGVSQMFGIVLEKNFNHPFFAKSASEFWRRWHITLGVWFRDYVYMPLVISPRLIRLSGMAGRKAGKRAGRAVLTVVPLSVVWVLTGLWHGTGASYLVWGVYWGSLIILSTVFAPEIRKMSKILHVDPEKKGWKVFQTIRTFLLFCIGRIITVPGDLHVSGMIFKRILTQPKLWQLVDNTLYEQGLEWKEFALALFAAGILWFVDIQQEKGCVREKIAGWYLPVRCVFYAASIMAVIIFGIYGPDQGGSNFVYIQF